MEKKEFAHTVLNIKHKVRNRARSARRSVIPYKTRVNANINAANINTQFGNISNFYLNRDKYNTKDTENFYKDVQQMAANNNADENFNLACRIRNDRNLIPYGNIVAMYFFKSAADKGNAEAAYRYATMLYNKGQKIFGFPNREESEVLENLENGDFSLRRFSLIRLPDIEQAISYFGKAAHSGYPYAIFQYPKILEENCDDIDNNDDALRKVEFFYKIAARSGNFYALQRLAFIVEKRDPHEAIKYWEQLARMGDVNAMSHCAFFYDYGSGRDPDKAAKFYLMAAKTGEKNAVNTFVSKYLFTKEVNPQVMLKILSQAASDGNFFGMFGLYYMYDNGIGVEKNSEIADKYCKMCADTGNIDSILKYAERQLNSSNIEEALIYFKKAADMGNITALDKFNTLTAEHNIAPNSIPSQNSTRNEIVRYPKNFNIENMYDRCSEQLQIIPFNIIKQRYGGREPKTRRDVDRLLFLARSCEIGFNAPYNPILATSFYKQLLINQAAPANPADPSLLCEIGCKFFYGRGVQKDVNTAAQFFYQATHNRVDTSPEAELNLAIMFYKGIGGVRKDLKAAAHYLKKAANNNKNPSAEAAFYYSIMLDRGIGVTKNPERSQEYFIKAALGGHPKALKLYLDSLQENEENLANIRAKLDRIARKLNIEVANRKTSDYDAVNFYKSQIDELSKLSVNIFDEPSTNGLSR